MTDIPDHSGEICCEDEECGWFGDPFDMVYSQGNYHCPDCGKVIAVPTISLLNELYRYRKAAAIE